MTARSRSDCSSKLRFDSPRPNVVDKSQKLATRIRSLAAPFFFLTALFFSIAPAAARADLFLNASFDTDTQGFSYADDVFRGSAAPTYASGSYVAAGGESGGGLQVFLGGLDNDDIFGMSGGYSATFDLTTQTNNVVFSFAYNLTQTADYENDEFSQVMASMDAVLLSGEGADYLIQIAGDGGGGAPISTGWNTSSHALGTLTAGTYTIIIGGYNNKKTLSNESTTIRIDNVRVEGDPESPCDIDAECDDGNLCTTDTCNAGLCENTPNQLSCDDGLSCTGGDTCSAGICQGIDLCAGDASCSPSASLCEEPAGHPLVDALDFQAFKDHIADLSTSDPPIGGSRHWSQPGNAAALDYLENELASYGYVVERHAYTFSSQTRENVYATKIGSVRPDEMIIVSAHMDSFNLDSFGSVFAPGSNDDASGCALVLEAARVLANPEIQTDRSVRFILWNNEETGLNGSNAYVADRRALQGIENPPNSGLYPEPTWIGIITHDQILWDHGFPSGPTQSPNADMDIEYQASSSFAADSLALAQLVNQGNIDYAPAYPSEVTNDMCCTDSFPFRNDVASVSVRDNRRRAEIGNGANPTWHRNSDVYTTYSEADFAFGFSAVQATVGAVAEIVNARTVSTCGDGVLDAGESCDDGNFTGGDCCSAQCELEPAGTLCRGAAGICDLAETCNGFADSCPADLKSTAECRAATGVCDVAESCDGVLDTCPANSFIEGGAVCRAAAGICDLEESCSGSDADCPVDALAPATMLCRPTAGQCDVSEACTGASAACPSDTVLDGVACGDGNACTTGDLCVAGFCEAPASLDCDDGDPCTADSCDALTGCANAPIEGCVPPADVDASSSPGRFLLMALLLALGSGWALRSQSPGPKEPAAP